MEVSFMVTAFASNVSPSEIGSSDSYNKNQTQRLLKSRYEQTSTPGASLPAKPLRVLVIDNHFDGNRILSKLVNMWGHNCRAAFNGTSGLEVAEEFRPEVLILDILMPQMDGIELSKLLRQQTCFKETLIVVVTGCTDSQRRIQSEEAGIDLYLIKPISPHLLKAVLTNEAEHLAISRKPTLRSLSTVAWLPQSNFPSYRDISAVPNHEPLVALAT
jgi:CheY-like chemotaxis protein